MQYLFYFLFLVVGFILGVIATKRNCLMAGKELYVKKAIAQQVDAIASQESPAIIDEPVSIDSPNYTGHLILDPISKKMVVKK